MAVQSPIDLSLQITEHTDDISSLEYHGHSDACGTAFVENTATSAQIMLAKRELKPFITGGPLKNEKYIFEQLHFHWADSDHVGCEHTFDGCRYSMEAHLVHYNSKYSNFKEAVDKPDGLAVSGFFIQACGDKDLEVFNKITIGVEQVKKPFSKAPIDSDCLLWLSTQELNKHYCTYKGSLTTPPYYESVTWIVYKTPIYVSKRQVGVFRDLMSSREQNKAIVNNYRQVQKSNKKPQIIFVRNAIKLKSKL